MKPQLMLHDNEQIELEIQPMQNFALYRLISIGFITAIVVVALVFFSSADKDLYILYKHFGKDITQILGLIFIVAAAFVVGFFLWNTTNKTWYVLTTERCIIYCGFITLNKSILPYSKIIDVNLNQSVLRKMLNITCVKVVSAGNSYLLDGISEQDGQKIMQYLSRKITK